MSLRRLLLLTAALVLGAALWVGAPAGATENPDYTAPPPTTSTRWCASAATA